jgi:hypothetical protein
MDRRASGSTMDVILALRSAMASQVRKYLAATRNTPIRALALLLAGVAKDLL